MAEPSDQANLNDHMRSYVEAAEIRMRTLEQTVDRLRHEVEDRQEQLVEMSETQVDVAARELEAASAMAELATLHAAIHDPEARRRVRVKPPLETRGAKKREALENMRSLVTLEPLTVVTPALRFMGEVVEAE